MQNKIVGQQSPSEGVQGGWRTCAGTPGYYSWASNVISSCVFFTAGWTPHQAFFSQPTHASLASWCKYVVSIYGEYTFINRLTYKYDLHM